MKEGMGRGRSGRGWHCTLSRARSLTLLRLEIIALMEDQGLLVGVPKPSALKKGKPVGRVPNRF
jgi:hypothetical protein